MVVIAMAKNISFLELARKILLETKRPMTVEEIWDYSINTGYYELVNTKGKTPWRTMGAQIYVSIRDKKDSYFIKIDSKPKKFFLKELSNTNCEINQIIKDEETEVEEPKNFSFNERELHPFITYYANTFMNVYTKTIFHEKSNKKTYAQWLHPDLVGVYFPIDDWDSEVLDFGMILGSQLIKIYSFEVKKELTFSNLRESFFQAVSNSSWANEGYLVAAKISQDDEFITELKRLSASFGIGIIKLDIEDPDASDVMFPAKFRSNLDWDTVNKISNQNPDFRALLRRVKNDLSNKEIIKAMYDKVFDSDRLVNMLKP